MQSKERGIPERAPYGALLGSVPLAGSIAALLAMLLFAESARFGYVYDDVVIAQGDERLRDAAYYLRVWWEPWWYTSDSIGESRPLTSLSFWAQTQLHGAEPLPAHIANIVLMGILSFLVAVLAARWTGHRLLAWPTGLIFAAHPIHVEAVANLVGRAELLSAIFVVLALLGWLRWRRNITWATAALIAGCVLLAGQSKETGYLAAAVIALGELAERRRDPPPGQSLNRLTPLVACIACVALYAVVQRSAVRQRIVEVYGLRADTIDPILNPLVLSDNQERVATSLQLTGKAAQLLLFPVNQSPDYSPQMIVPSANPFTPLGMLGLLVLLAVALAVYRTWQSRSASLGPLLACGVAWIIPSNLLFPIGVILGERLLLLLSVFATIAAVGLVADWIRQRAAPDQRAAPLVPLVCLAAFSYLAAAAFNFLLAAAVSFDPWASWKCAGYAAILAAAGGFAFIRGGQQRPAAIATLAITFVFGISTLLYTPYWQSWSTLVLTTSARHPANAKFQGELSQLLLEQSVRLNTDMYAEAEQAARRAYELWPLQPAPYVTLACLAKRQGNDQKASELLARVRAANTNLSKYAFLLEHFGLDTVP